MRPPRPSRKVMDAAQQERVTNLVRESIQIEKSQKNQQTKKLQSLMAKITEQYSTGEQTRKEPEKADSLLSKIMEQ